MFFLTVLFIKLSVAPFSRYSYLQLSAVLRMREYSHTNVRYWDSNSGTGTGTLATAFNNFTEFTESRFACNSKTYRKDKSVFYDVCV